MIDPLNGRGRGGDDRLFRAARDVVAARGRMRPGEPVRWMDRPMAVLVREVARYGKVVAEGAD